MCGRYTITTQHTKIVQRWPFPSELPDIRKLVPSYNIAPSQKVVAAWWGPNGKALTGMRWGFLPPWAKDVAVGYKMINARSETIAEKPTFRKAFKEQRCLIVADGFYEWQKTGKTKQPVRIVLKSLELFAFAGLWSAWKDPETKAEILSCAIVTCAANTLLTPVHDRMPVILKKDAEEAWLDNELKDPAALQPVLHPYPDDEMEFYSVSPSVNAPTVNKPSLIDPV